MTEEEEDKEGFASAFSRAYKQSSGALGQLLGGCFPWLLAISVFILVVGLIVIVVALAVDNYR